MTTMELAIGRHRIVRLSDNSVLMELHGAMNGEEARAIVGAAEDWFGIDSTYFVLFDGKELSSLAPEGRKAFAEWVQKRRAPEYVAYYNVGFAVSTLIFLMNNAARLFGRPANTKTFGTEAEARAWLTSLGAHLEPS